MLLDQSDWDAVMLVRPKWLGCSHVLDQSNLDAVMLLDQSDWDVS